MADRRRRGDIEDVPTAEVAFPGAGSASRDAVAAAPSTAERDDTQKTDAHEPGPLDLESLVPTGREAFAAALRAANEVLPDAPVGKNLVLLARKSGMEPAAATALEAAIGRAQLPRMRGEIRFWLARLYRQMGWLDRAVAHLRGAIADSGGDARVRRAHAAMAARAGDLAPLAAALAESARIRGHQGRSRSAARLCLAEAGVRGRLGDLRAASSAFAQAAQHFASFGAAGRAFDAWAVSARALFAALAPRAEVDAAVAQVARAGKTAGRVDEAKALAKELLPPLPPPPAPPTARPLDPAAARTESQLIAQARWGELAHFYRERATQVESPVDRAEILSRLAEVLAEELSDPGSAAEAYGRIVALSGDPAALSAQLRILDEIGDAEGHARAAEAAIAASPDPRARGEAFVARGERLLRARKLRAAAPDFERARALDPANLRALVGLAECRGADGDGSLVPEVEAALAPLPRGTPGRGAQYRRLAQLFEWPLGDLDRCRRAWAEVLEEDPGDIAAEERLTDLARKSGDAGLLSAMLRRRLAREPRGAGAREARHELAQSLERAGRFEEAFEEWKTAARLDPGDARALLAVAERSELRGRYADAAAAIEGAALATEPGPPRAELWTRLAKICRERLADEARAAVCEARAKALLEPSEEKPALLPTPALSPAAAASPPDPTPGRTGAKARPGAAPATSPVEVVTSGDIVAAAPTRESKPARTRSSRSAPRRRAARGKSSPLLEARVAKVALHPEPRTDATKRRLTDEHYQFLTAIREAPLDPQRYRDLAKHVKKKGNHDKAALLLEVAFALAGETFPEPTEPAGTLTPTQLLSLRHRDLKGPVVEILETAGYALASLYPASARTLGTQPFADTAGKGGPFTARALIAAVRHLGIRAPEVTISQDEGPPVAVANADPPRLQIGKVAIRRQIAPSELRFFAGRALYTLSAEILALRALDADQISTSLAALAQAVGEAPPLTPQAKHLAQRVSHKARESLARLLGAANRQGPHLSRLREAARFTSNRAGLLAAGAVGPSMVALRAKRGAAEEIAELATFAASDRYLVLRKLPT